MNQATPSMADLFGQLGLENNDGAIEQFIEQHRGLGRQTKLEDASFWNSSQSQFLRSALDEDAEWAELIDQLNIRLR